MPDLQAETTEVLQTLIRFNTVNPPGNERAAIEYLEAYVRAAGFETELLAADPERPNLIATLARRRRRPDDGLPRPRRHRARPADDWQHDPWGGRPRRRPLWGRGAARHEDRRSPPKRSAPRRSPAAGWRPARGTLKLVFVADEETGGDVGARWLTEQHPDKVSCDLLLNEGAGSTFEYGDVRRYGVCCGEKGIFRFRLTARGVAGHASLPRTGDNALLKLAPVLERLAGGQPGYDLTDHRGRCSRRSVSTPRTQPRRLPPSRRPIRRCGSCSNRLLGVTLTPTVVHASDKINVIPSRAELKVDCRVPPGFGDELALARLREVLGDAADGVEIEFTEKVFGYVSPTGLP